MSAPPPLLPPRFRGWGGASPRRVLEELPAPPSQVWAASRGVRLPLPSHWHLTPLSARRGPELLREGVPRYPGVPAWDPGALRLQPRHSASRGAAPTRVWSRPTSRGCRGSVGRGGGGAVLVSGLRRFHRCGHVVAQVSAARRPKGSKGLEKYVLQKGRERTGAGAASEPRGPRRQGRSWRWAAGT